jgi:hypothetical protein
MIENHLTADYYWGKLMTAYRAYRDTLSTEDYYYANAPVDCQAYRDYRDAADQWERFCARDDIAIAAGKLRRAGFEVVYNGGYTALVPGKFLVYPWGISRAWNGFDEAAARAAAELIGVEVKTDA